MMSLSEAARAVSGRLVGADATFTSVSTDSRAFASGALFVALRGDRFDGHQFVGEVLKSGAAGAMVDGKASSSSSPVVVVDDTRQALGRLAGAWRAKHSGPVIGVVGSNGKTTVKEMIAAILREHFSASATLATEGNLNNDIGLPLTLLRLRAPHRAAVVEIGMNHPGETAMLAAMARPTIGLINNAQREHQEFMKSVAEVAREHADLLRALPEGGIAVLNADDEFYPLWREVARERKLVVRDFGIKADAAVRAKYTARGHATAIELTTPEGSTRFELQLGGAHNVSNALAAAAAASAAGASLEAVARALGAFSAVKGRQQRRTSRGGAAIIDDTYNANPESVRAAIDVLRGLPAPTVLVLGDMGEVGDHGEAFHSEVGAYAREAGIGRLFTLGTLARHSADAFGEGARHAETIEELIAAVREHDVQGATLLIKGSRFMRMERVVAALAPDAGGEGH